MTTIKIKGSQQFSVPNNEEGLAFIFSLRKFASKNVRIRCFGRAKNRVQRIKFYKGWVGNGVFWGQPSEDVLKYQARQNIPFACSQWFAVYIYRKSRNNPITEIVRPPDHQAGY